MGGLGMGGLESGDAKSRRLCGGRPGLLYLADDARRSEPSIVGLTEGNAPRIRNNEGIGVCCGRSCAALI